MPRCPKQRTAAMAPVLCAALPRLRPNTQLAARVNECYMSINMRGNFVVKGIVASEPKEARLVAQMFLWRYKRSCKESEIKLEEVRQARRTAKENETKGRGAKTTAKKTQKT